MPQEDFHTLAGFVFGQLGRAPEESDEVVWDGLRFTVVDVDGARIEKLEVEFLEGHDVAEPAAAERA
jgi:putative hemolysin